VFQQENISKDVIPKDSIPKNSLSKDNILNNNISTDKLLEKPSDKHSTDKLVGKSSTDGPSLFKWLDKVSPEMTITALDHDKKHLLENLSQFEGVITKIYSNAITKINQEWDDSLTRVELDKLRTQVEKSVYENISVDGHSKNDSKNDNSTTLTNDNSKLVDKRIPIEKSKNESLCSVM